MTLLIDNLTSEGLLTTSALRYNANVQATAAGTQTVTVTSPTCWMFTGSTFGQIFQLGNATTYNVGHTYIVRNQASVSMTITDFAGIVLLTLPSLSVGDVALQDNSTTAGVWSAAVRLVSYSTSTGGTLTGSPGALLRWEDFAFNANSSDKSFSGEWIDSTFNGGTVISPDTITGADYIGVSTLGTGTSSNGTGRTSIVNLSGFPMLRLGGMRTIVEARVRLLALSGTPSYQFSTGLCDAAISGIPANGVYFYYTHSTNSGRWTGTCRSSSTSSTRNSTVAVAANTWYKLTLDIDAVGGSVTFFVNGMQMGAAIVSNIPTADLMFFIQIEKTSSTTVSRFAHIDYFYWNVIR